MNPIEVAVCAMMMLMRGETYRHIDHGDGSHTVIIVPPQSDQASAEKMK